jgi:AcrR family transcriptional regulator
MATSTTRVRPLRSDARRNRERIVAAARDAFASGGIDVPVDEIARRAGVGMGTLYRRFPTKDDLIDAVLEETVEQFVAAAHDALANKDAWAGFCGFLERIFLLHMKNRSLKHVLLATAHGRDRAEAVRERVRPLMRALVQRAHEQGTLRPDFAAEDMPLVFWTGSRVIEATVDVAPELWRRYLGLLLDGLRADAATQLPVAALSQGQLDRVAARHGQ